MPLNRQLTVLFALVLVPLPAQADDAAASASAPSYASLRHVLPMFKIPPTLSPMLSKVEVIRQCLARVNQLGGSVPAPTAEALAPDQWVRFAHCSIGINTRFDPGSISGNPDVVVNMDLNTDGTVGPITLELSGDANWDRAIQEAINAMPTLPPAPAARTYQTLSLHFPMAPPGQGLAGSGVPPMLSGTTHWSLRHCLGQGAATTCN